MPLISTIGRKAVKTRILVWTIYVVLTLGALTMVYPFLLMVAGSSKSAVDTQDSRVIPAFLVNDTALYRKHMEGLFNESLQAMKIAHASSASSFQGLSLPPSRVARAAVWREFLEETELPSCAYTCGYLSATVSRGVHPHLLRAFKKQLMARFDGDIVAMNRAMGTRFVNWSAFYVIPEDYLQRSNKQAAGPFYQAFREFKAMQPLADRYYFSTEGFYKSSFLKTQYTKDIAAYNAAHGTQYASWDDTHLDRRLPKGPGRTDKEREDWTMFVRSILNLFWIRADADAAPGYHAFLRAKYRAIDILNRNYGTGYAEFDEIPLIQEPTVTGLPLSDWDAYLQGWRDPDTGAMHMLPTAMLYIHSVDFLFRDYLRERYETLDAVNGALGTDYADWLSIVPPQEDLHYQAFVKQRRWLRWEFVRRNYITVTDYIILHGRGVVNTAIYCLLAILAALTVNPLAAYALSRYKPPTAYKVLLFLMLTMAFPPMVTQIPNFLLLRELGLLNTFWALVLPGLANGYSIFLLKGFFDSLPQELYESAAIDGAGEFRIFFQITMSLSKPILAVIGLSAFTMAYSNFMMALLICQDQKMWTLMPWLYQLQQTSGQGVVFASLIIAAIPTFLVFVFCQNIIMRGIVVPVEK